MPSHKLAPVRPISRAKRQDTQGAGATRAGRLGEGMSTPSGVDLGARVRRVCASLSEPQLRVVFAAVDVLTCIKKWNTRPTATLVQRKVQNALVQLEGDEEALCFLVDSAFLKAGVRLGVSELEGVSRAVRGSHMTYTAEELAHVHARGVVVSEEAIAYARWQMSHALRIGRECLIKALIQGLPLIPVATDLYTLAIEELARGEGNETEALKMLGVDGVTVLDDMYLANEKGLLRRPTPPHR